MPAQGHHARPSHEGPGPLPEDLVVAARAGVAVDLTAAIPVPSDVAMVGTDLDGTLLGPDLTVGARSVAAIPALVEAGIELVYVTGRPPRWLPPVTTQTGHADLAVCANGALLVDLAEERLLRGTSIDAGLALEIVHRLRTLVPGISYAVERLAPDADRVTGLANLTIVGFESGYDPPWAQLPGVEHADVVDLISRGRPVKILATPPAGAGHSTDSLLELAEAEFHDVLHITHSGMHKVIIEIMAGQIDKGIAFLEIAERRGIDPGATIAVGDMPNDVALIGAAGTGYAVANGHRSAIAAADHVIPSNIDDGVGRLLEAVLAGRR